MTSDMIELEFQPEAWRNDYAIPVDPRGETNFEVPVDEVPEEGLPPSGHVGDRFKHHENAPEWVRDWDGPFTITVA